MEIFVKAWIIQIDPQDADLVHAHNWRIHKNGRTFYVVRTLRKQTKRSEQQLHRLILARMLGRELEASEVCDHINGDGLDNRRANLRPATARENQHNARKRIDNVSGHKGASFHKATGKWQAQIQIDGKVTYLGYYATAELAHAAYREAAARFYGEFARFE